MAASTAEVDRLTARIKKMEDDQHRLEERIAVLTRDLEVTETELIRTKARLKGNETKAEASAAIAEARILAGRLAEDKTQASVLARSEESLAKAEEQLSEGNFGAALFFASKAQDLVARVKQGAGTDQARDPSAAPDAAHSVAVELRRARRRPHPQGPGPLRRRHRPPARGRAGHGRSRERRVGEGDVPGRQRLGALLPAAVMRAGSLRAAALYAALTVLLTYPLAFRLHLMDAGDSAFFAWAIGWERHALFHAPARLPHGNMFFPLRYTLGMDEPVLGTTVLVLPARPLHGRRRPPLQRRAPPHLRAQRAHRVSPRARAGRLRGPVPARRRRLRVFAGARRPDRAPQHPGHAMAPARRPLRLPLLPRRAARATRWPRGRCSRSRPTPAGTTA